MGQEHLLSAISQCQSASLVLERDESAFGCMPSIVASDRGGAHEIGVNEGRPPAIDIFESLPDNGRLVQEGLVGYEGIQGVVIAW